MGWIYLPNCNNPMGTWIIIDQWISLFSHLDRAILFQQQGVSTHFRGDWVSSLADYWRHFQGMLLIFDTVLFDTIPARRLCWVRSFNSTQPDFHTRPRLPRPGLGTAAAIAAADDAPTPDSGLLLVAQLASQAPLAIPVYQWLWNVINVSQVSQVSQYISFTSYILTNTKQN